MCQQEQQQFNIISNNNNNSSNSKSNKMKPSYSIKKVLKTFFKKQQKQQQQQHHHQHHQQQYTHKISNSLESLESFDNLRNSQMEEQYYEEIIENCANEKLADINGANNAEDIYVPVRFARTEAGTFFWTTNLQPVLSTITPAADEDLLQPAYCYSNCQYPQFQCQDRWAQA